MKPFSYKSEEWKALRLVALRRDGFCCVWCGDSVRGKFAGRVDHIATVRERPDLAYTLSNLRTLCNDCDAKRHADKGLKGEERQKIGLDGFPEPV